MLRALPEKISKQVKDLSVDSARDFARCFTSFQHDMFAVVF